MTFSTIPRNCFNSSWRRRGTKAARQVAPGFTDPGDGFGNGSGGGTGGAATNTLTVMTPVRAAVGRIRKVLAGGMLADMDGATAAAHSAALQNDRPDEWPYGRLEYRERQRVKAELH